jgi:hypothetical protein
MAVDDSMSVNKAVVSYRGIPSKVLLAKIAFLINKSPGTLST